jgi:hypothetical protein
VIPASHPSTVSHVLNAPTTDTRDRSGVILNGLPHLVGRATFTVFGGILQPALRESWTLCGLANKSPEPTGIGAGWLSAGVVGLFIFSGCRWLSFFR